MFLAGAVVVLVTFGLPSLAAGGVPANEALRTVDLSHLCPNSVTLTDGSSWSRTGTEVLNFGFRCSYNGPGNFAAPHLRFGWDPYQWPNGCSAGQATPGYGHIGRRGQQTQGSFKSAVAVYTEVQIVSSGPPQIYAHFEPSLLEQMMRQADALNVFTPLCSAGGTTTTPPDDSAAKATSAACTKAKNKLKKANKQVAKAKKQLRKAKKAKKNKAAKMKAAKKKLKKQKNKQKKAKKARNKACK